jgi:transcriptional regulator with XRE-family HTH domain
MRGPAQPPTSTSRRLALALREGRGPTTQEALARRMGVSTRTVIRAESGDRPPTAAFINLWLATAEVDDELRSTIRDLFRSARLEARQHATDTQGRRADPILSAHVSAQLVGDDEVAAAVTEAHRLTTVMQPTPVTTSTLDALEHAVHNLDAAGPDWRCRRSFVALAPCATRSPPASPATPPTGNIFAW